MTDAKIFELPTDHPERAPKSVEPLLRHVIGDVLRRARVEQKRTLKDVADAAQVSIPYLSEIERGRKEASSEVLSAVCRSLGIPLLDLIGLAHRQVWELQTVRPIGTGAFRISTPASPTSSFGGFGSARLLAA